MFRHRLVLPILQAAVTLALLAWIFSSRRLREESVALLRLADWRWVLAGWLAAGCNELAGAVRWWCCVRLAGLPVAFRRAAALHFVGLFSSLFLPGSIGGDAVKIAWLAAEFPSRKIGGVLAVLMDRLSGLVTIMATMLVIVWMRLEWFQQSPHAAALFRGAMIFFAMSALGLFLWWLTSRPRLLRLHPPWLPMRARILEIACVFDTFLKGGRWAAATIALSSTAFAFFALTYFCAAQALRVPVAFLDLFTMMPVIDVITMIPITLSGMGLREKTFETMLGALCGIPSSAAVLVSLGGFGLASAWALLGAPVFSLYRARAAEAQA